MVRSGNFRFASCSIFGKLPSDIGSLNLMSILEGPGNFLSGSIPSEIGLLTKLSILVLNTNKLSGQIPDEFENLSNLEYLTLQNNLVSGNLEGLCNNLVKEMRDITLRVDSKDCSGPQFVTCPCCLT